MNNKKILIFTLTILVLILFTTFVYPGLDGIKETFKNVYVGSNK